MDKDLDPCEVCNVERAETLPASSDEVHQSCPRCGEFKLSGSAASVLRRNGNRKNRTRLSGWVRSQNNAGSVPTVSTTVLKGLLSAPQPTITQRAYNVLLEAERGLGALGEQFNVYEPRFLGASFSDTKDEVAYLTRLLKSLGMLQVTTLDGKAEILPAGYVKLDELRESPATSSKGFIATWFDPSMNEVYEKGLQGAVFGAGYDPIRIDRVEHINRIDDEIIRQINGCRFVVADFTGHRGGVYFEAGYALGKSLPVFWTCRKSDIAALHFDIRQFNCIAWDDAKDLSSRLSARIEAVLGPGPLRSPQ